MNCTNHPDIIVKTSCDVCHKPYCPSCLQDDRGRFVCRQCFDPAQPLVVSIEDSSVTNSRYEACQAFFKTRLGVAVIWAAWVFIVVMWLKLIYSDATSTHGFDRGFYNVRLVIDVVWLPLFLMSEFISNRKTRNQPRPTNRQYSLMTNILFVVIILWIPVYLWFQLIRTQMMK